MKTGILQRLTARVRQRERQMGEPSVAVTSLTSRLFSGAAAQQLIDPYSQHPVVYACIKLLADEVGQVSFKIYSTKNLSRTHYMRARMEYRDGACVVADQQRLQNLGFEEAGRDHPLVKLFDRPNPLQSSSQFWQGVTTFLAYNGECAVVLPRANVTQIPAYMIPANPGYFTPYPTRAEVPQYWEYRAPNAPLTHLDPCELIRPRTFNPRDIRRGLSPLSVAMQGLQMNWASRLYNLAFFENDATPGGFFLTEYPWKKQQRDDWIEGYEKRHRGASNAFMWALLTGIKDVKLVGYSPKDIQFPTLQKMSKEEVAMIWRVPLSFLSDTARINYATDKAERKAFWTDTVIPIIRHLEDIFWAEFFQYIEGGRYWGAFDLSNIEALQEDFSAKLEQAYKLYLMTVPFNRINERLKLGFESLPWGDTAFVNAAMVPITSFIGSEETPPEQPAHSRIIRPPTGHEKMFAQFNTAREKHIKVFVGKYKRYLFDLRKYLLARVEEVMRSPETVANVLLGNQQRWDRLLQQVMEDVYYDAIDDSYAIAAQQAGAPPFLTASSPETLNNMNMRNNYLKGINDNIFDDLRVTIIDGLNNNETINEIRNRVRDVMNFNTSRALTVARTEVGSAMSSARHAEFGKDGVEYTRWTIADMLARTSHQAAQGEGPVALGELFSSTLCRYPLDPLGPPGEVINCRCVSVPVARKGKEGEE